jgi:GAF domain-containing protein
VKDQRRPASYVQRVRQDTRRYIDQLLSENEKLSAALASAENEQERVQRELSDLQAALQAERNAAEELRRRFSDIASERERFHHEYLTVEEQNNNLANLYVATYSLHGTLDHQELLSIIQEIVSNLIGSEEIAIFEKTNGAAVPELVASWGVDTEGLHDLMLDSGIIGQVIRTGDVYINPEPKRDSELAGTANVTACIPLRLEGEVYGAIALFRLLEQKPGLELNDSELLDLLASQAAIALYSARLHGARLCSQEASANT